LIAQNPRRTREQRWSSSFEPCASSRPAAQPWLASVNDPIQFDPDAMLGSAVLHGAIHATNDAHVTAENLKAANREKDRIALPRCASSRR
jgi:hypothetical protein